MKLVLSQISWLFLVSLVVVIHEGTWRMAPYWLPFMRAHIIYADALVIGLIVLAVLSSGFWRRD